ncbi:hypothetical protein ABZ079_27935 [Streptomyces sp. NPDC006314]|uniref:hypothetical protein n=1 Tax=Streptomyces sp. NPDC006314 TaxID=3154475 RepID=UPI0033ACA096
MKWEIQMHEQFSGVWICKDFGRATTGADPTELGRAVLAAYLAGRSTRGETFRAVVRAGNDSLSVITPDKLAGPGCRTDPAICQALPVYLRNALA